jgi:hypothetical protein
MKGWEISPDKIKIYEKMMEDDFIGDPIITSKCSLAGPAEMEKKGVLIASTNGFAWKSKTRVASVVGAAVIGGAWLAGNVSARAVNKWMGWHDVYDIKKKKDHSVIILSKIAKKPRKNDEIVSNKKEK